MMNMLSNAPLPWLMTAMLCLGACGTGDIAPEPAADEPGANVVAADGVAGDVGLETPDGIGGDPGPDAGTVTLGWTPTTHPVGKSACCLTLSADRMVWAQDGDLYMVEGVAGAVEVLVDHPGVQTDPVLSGDRVVWADDRSGDFDLYALDLATGTEQAIVVAPGDQYAPSLDGDRLVWVGLPTADATAAEADIWTLELGSGGEPVQLTSDAFEQSFPHVNGSRVVWTDFRNDPDGQYMDPQGTAENNGDILGHDLATNEPFEVTVDPGKQLRPAIEGDTVVWLDWRDQPEDLVGVEPEPKYHHFKIYVRTLPQGEERYLEAGGWQQPELWQRPGIHQGHVAWITDAGQTAGAQTAVRISEVATGESTLVHGVDGVLVGLDFRDGVLGWIGGGEVGMTPFAPGSVFPVE